MIPANQSVFLNCSHQCGVNSLNLVLLKGSEARHLAAQVGVDEHLRWTEETSNPGRLHSKWNHDVCVQCFHMRQHQIKAFSSRRGHQTCTGPSAVRPHHPSQLFSPCVQPVACGRIPFQWGTSSQTPLQSTCPSAASHSAGLRASVQTDGQKGSGEKGERECVSRGATQWSRGRWKKH